MMLRLLEGERSDMELLQDLLESAEDYYQAITGYPPGQAESQTLYSSLPEGKSYDDKFLFGLFDGDELMACADVIRNYPKPGVAEIGTLVVRRSFRRRGLGACMIALLEKNALDWSGVERLRCELPIVLTGAICFAEVVGFRPTGEVREYEYSHIGTKQAAFEKSLRAQ